MYQPATAPQSIGGVLDGGFRLFRASFTQVFLLAIVAAIVVAPAGLIAQALQGTPPSAGTVAAIVIGGVVLLAVLLTISAAIIARIDAVAVGRRLTVAEALAIGFRRAPALLGCGILVGLAVACGFVLLIIPGIIVMVWMLFAPYLVVTNQLGPIGSIAYSFRLVRGHWWRTAALITIIGIIAGVLYMILAIVLGVSLATDPDALAQGRLPWYVDFLVSPLISAVATPLGYAMLIAVLQDLKLRYRGDDLAARIATA
jgi:hypothetical protein